MKIISPFREIFWPLNIFCLRNYLMPKMGVRVEPGTPKLPKRPFVMVCNHGTFLDPWIALHKTIQPVSIMMNEEGFKGGAATRWYLDAIGAFPKKKGAADFKAMKTTLSCLSNKVPVLIFPEAQVTWDGESQPIYPGIEKIVRKAGVPLVVARLRGNFLTRPWWAKTARKGKIFLTWSVYTTDMIKEMTDEQVRDAMIAGIRHNELRDPQIAATPFSGDGFAEGLENFIWKCRSCGTDDHIETSGNEFRCTHCGAIWAVDSHLKFSPLNGHAGPVGDLHDYANWLKAGIAEKVDIAPDTEVLAKSVDAVLIKTEPDGVYTPLATGTLELDKKEIRFLSDTAGFTIPVSETSDCTFQRNKVFEFHHKKVVYQFLFETKSPIKWVWWFRGFNNYAASVAKGYHIS